VNICEIRPSIRREVIVNRGKRERAIAKGGAAAFANSKPAQDLPPSFAPRFANRNAIVAAATMPAMLSLSFYQRMLYRFLIARNQSNAGRCFINTPIVNCYHLIKSHFPRAFHDSADQEERLLRRSVIKTAALVVLPVPPAPSFSFLLISLFFSLLPLPPLFSLFLYQFRTMIMKSLTSTSIDPLNGNVYPNCEKLRDHA